MTAQETGASESRRRLERMEYQIRNLRGNPLNQTSAQSSLRRKGSLVQILGKIEVIESVDLKCHVLRLSFSRRQLRAI